STARRPGTRCACTCRCCPRPTPTSAVSTRRSGAAAARARCACSRCPPCRGATDMKPARGFTLVELLVALVILSILAMMAWRAIDAMGTTQTITRNHADELRRLQSALGQWNADLDALVDTREVTAIQFNGQVLRLTRRDPMETGLESR